MNRLLISSLMALAVLAGCASQKSYAPVEDRSSGRKAPAGAVIRPLLPGYENAGKPGYYTVKPGDTLIRIALDAGQNWRDIARWNGLTNPDLIEVEQVLRVAPPGSEASTVATTRPIVTSSVSPTQTSTVASSTQNKSQPTAAQQQTAAPQPAASTTPVPSEDDVNWLWPTEGNVVQGYDESKNKGLNIAGKTGQPVVAAGDGRVVYSGSGLRGYGNLIIVKHNNTYLSAYAHNQTLLVKDDEVVKRGQKIAEMGSSDADRPMLHFEIRRQGKPVDPTKYFAGR